MKKFEETKRILEIEQKAIDDAIARAENSYIEAEEQKDEERAKYLCDLLDELEEASGWISNALENMYRAIELVKERHGNSGD